MAEEFRTEEFIGQASAVGDPEGSVFSERSVVYRFRKRFFTRSVFAKDEGGGIGRLRDLRGSFSCFFLKILKIQRYGLTFTSDGKACGQDIFFDSNRAFEIPTFFIF